MTMRTLLLPLLVAVLASAGCATIEPLPARGGQTFVPVYGRAYFMRNGTFGSRVLVCDVRQSSGDVVCYETQAGSN
jgi:hypothetical protein